MKFSARVQNTASHHEILLKVGDKQESIAIAPRPTGGSSVSGGELLFLALATCYCNDIYREANKRGINVDSVEVEVDGDFESEGQPASNIIYRANVKAQASDEEILDLLKHTDTVAEVQNTLRKATPVTLQF
jgi:uncharacterized OsmC-like protein